MVYLFFLYNCYVTARIGDNKPVDLPAQSHQTMMSTKERPNGDGRVDTVGYSLYHQVGL